MADSTTPSRFRYWFPTIYTPYITKLVSALPKLKTDLGSDSVLARFDMLQSSRSGLSLTRTQT